MIRAIPTSISDFRKLREDNFEYIDKTHLITEFVDRSNYEVILLPRPRRFGKTLNMTTLKWFFEKRDEDVWHLFADLHVGRAGEKYRAHFQKYPVIFISLKETKAQSFDACLQEAKRLIRDLYAEHRLALEGKLDPVDKADFDAIWLGTADDSLYRRSLKDLTRYLHNAHGVKPIILIDEYDAGIHAAHANGFYKEAISFFGGFFLAGLKDNQHLERGVLTGILRVSRESIFSDLNSLGGYTLLSPEFSTCFGFTQPEVEALLKKVGALNMLSAVRAYYNGYEFGGVEIYNPWSILSFLARGAREVVPHWVGTSSNLLIQELLRDHGMAVEREMQILMEGGQIEKRLQENIVFPQLKTDRDALWSLLVFTGYLKASRQEGLHEDFSPKPYLLSIPNKEVKTVYQTTFQVWLKESLKAQDGSLDTLLTKLLEGDAEEFEAQLQRLAVTLPSYHDVKGVRPEAFYHGMVIGLLASLEPDYEVRSNRESGEVAGAFLLRARLTRPRCASGAQIRSVCSAPVLARTRDPSCSSRKTPATQGRPDVLITPRRPGKPGVVLELKSARKGHQTIESALREGLRQLEANDYAADLRAAGVQTILQMAVAFDGKRVRVLPKGAKAPVSKRAKRPKRSPTKKKL
ncbi:MAG: AAA family ATPase [Polyangiaceae bacterium]|nr:AAA family ATPase [Polyangiaceae bacterium]